MLDDDLFNAECDILLIVDSLERQVLTVLTLSVNKILFYQMSGERDVSKKMMSD